MKTNYVLSEEKSTLHRINVNGILFVRANGNHSRINVGNGSVARRSSISLQSALQGKSRERAGKEPRKSLKTVEKMPPDCPKTAGLLLKYC